MDALWADQRVKENDNGCSRWLFLGALFKEAKMTNTQTPIETISEAPSSAGGSKLIALLEIGLVLLPVLLSKFVGALDFVEASSFRNFVGPGSIVVSVLLATFLLRRRGITWGDIGMRRPKSMMTTGAWTIVAVVAVFIVPGMVISYLNQIVDLPQIDTSRFASLSGNLPMLLTWLAIGWTAAAFGEEMLARGFLLNRFADVFGDKAIGFGLAAIFQAVVFGLAHIYQGWTGVLVTGLVGLIWGFVYVAGKRSLWPVIIAHGLVDTVGLTQLYLMSGHM